MKGEGVGGILRNAGLAVAIILGAGTAASTAWKGD